MEPAKEESILEPPLPCLHDHLPLKPNASELLIVAPWLRSSGGQQAASSLAHQMCYHATQITDTAWYLTANDTGMSHPPGDSWLGLPSELTLPGTGPSGVDLSYKVYEKVRVHVNLS